VFKHAQQYLALQVQVQNFGNVLQTLHGKKDKHTIQPQDTTDCRPQLRDVDPAHHCSVTTVTRAPASNINFLTSPKPEHRRSLPASSGGAGRNCCDLNTFSSQ